MDDETHRRQRVDVTWPRRTCIALGVLVVASFATPLGFGLERKPNFVVILADDLGYGDIRPFGGWIDTPHLEKMARQGLRLTDFHSNGAVCSPTRAALMTGRYQQRAGIAHVVTVKLRHHGLQPHETTFARLFQEAGYRTGIFGKWHLGYRVKYNPIRHGFDEFRGYLSGNVDFFSHVDQAGTYDWWRQDELVKEPGYTTHLITKHAVDFIRRHRDRPFCLYVPHEAPHYPYQGPHDQAERSVGGTFRSHGSRPDKRAAYEEMVVAMDQGIGEILAVLTELELDTETFVFFCSDNGATKLGSNGPLRGVKGTLWEGGHRVPAIAWWPGRIQPGSSDQLTMGFDLMPTLLSLAGISKSVERPMDGVDLSSLLLRGDKLEDRRVFWQHKNQQAMRDGNWKLVRTLQEGDVVSRLFDLSSDVAEANDVAGQHHDRVVAMQKTLDRWFTHVTRGATQQPLSTGN